MRLLFLLLIFSACSKNTNDQVCMLLDRGLERFQAGDASGAIDDFQVAIETIDYLNQCNLMETLGQTLFYDGASPYRGEDYEQLLARIYFSFACDLKGEVSNARALLRQAEEWSELKKEEYRRCPITENLKITDNALGKYLLATYLEKRSSATLLVFFHNGRAPYKYTTYSPASQASALAFEFFMGRQAAVSTLTGIPVPELARQPYSLCSFQVKVGDVVKQPVLVFNILEAAELELIAKRPIVIARGAARLASRRAAVLAAGKQDPQLGCIIDLSMLIVNACTPADTRSWKLLPERIELARFDLQPGCHTLDIHGFKTQLHLKKGDLCILHVFPHQILIPERFQEAL